MATILAAFAPTVVALLGSLVADRIILYSGLNRDVRKLKRKIEEVKGVIAEHESAVQDAATKNWLKQWKDIMYDIDDIIDWCRIEAEKRGATWPRFRLERQVSTVLSCKIIDVDCKIARAIRKLNISAEELSNKRPAITGAMDDQTAGTSRSYLFNAPVLADLVTVGGDIEKSAKNLIDLLMTRKDESSLCLFAVVGTIGVGKSTFAGKIYHNRSICDAFPIRVWVCPSRYTSNFKLWQGSSSTKEQADEEQLHSMIAGQKFLLVVDDLWTHNFWERLWPRLRQGSPDGRVIITTRYKNLAKRISVPQSNIYQVNKLDQDDGWLLLQKEVSIDASHVTKEMQEIGRRIVQKCDGLPMVICGVAGALREQDTRAGWENVYNTDFLILSSGISGAINLSYMDLGPYQKQCFLYCGLFPEGFVFEKNYVTHQWISQGFVEVTKNSTPEELAEVYFDELITKGFLQMQEGTDMIKRVKMPHILHSFAQDLSKDDSSTGDSEHWNDAYETRHFSFSSKSMPAPNEISKLNKLRTLLLFQNSCEPGGMEEHLRRLTLLRVLDLHATPIEAVPTTLGRLIHLRYLNLSETRIRELPDTIRFLKALQYLILKGCPLIKLPRGIGQLKKLRWLDISRTKLNTVEFKFKNLEELNCLHGFVVNTRADEPDGWPLKEVSYLSKLTSLHISRIEKCLRSEDARESELSSKSHLKELKLCCTGVESPMEVPQEVERIEGIFQELHPPKCLEYLKLENYYGRQYPWWILALENLQRLDLYSCCHCEALPALGELPHLRFLTIAGSNALRTIGTELRGDKLTAFPVLEYVQIERMSKLESWSGLKDTDRPSLQKSEIKCCPNLNSLPSGIAHSKALTTLHIEDCDGLEKVENLRVLKELTVVNNRNLKELTDLPELEVLQVDNCRELNILNGATSLRRLQIAGRHLQELPKWLARHTSTLQRLEIIGTKDLLWRYFNEVSTDRLLIEGIAHVYGRTSDDKTAYMRSRSMLTIPRDNHTNSSNSRWQPVWSLIQATMGDYGSKFLTILFICASQYIINMAVTSTQKKM